MREEFFEEALRKRPVILHLICHGGFTNENHFFLEFESNNGELMEYEGLEMKRLIEDCHIGNDVIKIVFINACFSEQVSQIFIDFGVDCVISIKSNAKIVDRISSEFSKYFYKFLFDGMTIKDSF